MKNVREPAGDLETSRNCLLHPGISSRVAEPDPGFEMRSDPHPV